jgi:hypothetical protein
MNRIQLACYGLLTSAFVLSGILMSMLPSRLEPRADADSLVISRDNFTIMTAKTRANEESLFVLENTSQKLIVYSVDLGKKRMEVAGIGDLAKVFGTQAGQRNDRPGRGAR